MIITYEFSRDEVNLCALSVKKFFKNTNTLVRRRIPVGKGYMLSIATGNMADIGCEIVAFKSETGPTDEDYDRMIRIHNIEMCDTLLKNMISDFPRNDGEVEEWRDDWQAEIYRLSRYYTA